MQITETTVREFPACCSIQPKYQLRERVLQLIIRMFSVAASGSACVLHSNSTSHHHCSLRVHLADVAIRSHREVRNLASKTERQCTLGPSMATSGWAVAGCNETCEADRAVAPTTLFHIRRTPSPAICPPMARLHQPGVTDCVSVSRPGVRRDPRPARRLQRDAGRQRPVQALRRARVARRIQPERQLPVQLHQGYDDLPVAPPGSVKVHAGPRPDDGCMSQLR